ncbi:SCO3242 family prenyltransferase [Streptomyces pathocidini]|uniref:SCO3242 family prenyltransferase n=1 Tax=Streptomyces pathocidini TaxID=1650571 RepID=A0ABW7UJY7_9ACTN|nr:UbiA family prenyltransferase [Streptomyces pathocidini]
MRVSALFTVPGDALAGAAAAALRPNRGTALAAGASLCLYEAGMALNDWADRDIDATERPHRPLPSGRIAPGAALAAAGGLTAAALALSAAAGRPALATATALAAAVWAYDLGLKNTPAGPLSMATARALDLLLGAAATAGERTPTASVRAALPSAALLGAHTLAVTGISRHEAQGGSSAAPLAALAVTAGIAGPIVRAGAGRNGGRPGTAAVATGGLAVAYGAAVARPYAHAVLNPSPPLLQRAVGGGIRAMIPLQATLAARAGSVRTALPLLALLPVARRLSRKVSPT